jgi:hypothetical protein
MTIDVPRDLGTAIGKHGNDVIRRWTYTSRVLRLWDGTGLSRREVSRS